MQVLFLQGRSTCFGRKRPSSGVFKTSTAATGTCVIVAVQSSHLLIRAGTAYLIVPDGCIRSVQFSFDVLVVVYLSCLFGIAKF